MAYTAKNNVHHDLGHDMSTWQEEGARAAREMNERARQESNARASVAPINEVNQILKEIKALLIEIREAIKNG